MEKKCVKCGQFMLYEEEMWSCEHCLKEIVDYKRKAWEGQSKEKEEVERSCDSCKQEVSVINLIMKEGSIFNICDDCLERSSQRASAILFDIKEANHDKQAQ